MNKNKGWKVDGDVWKTKKCPRREINQGRKDQ